MESVVPPSLLLHTPLLNKLGIKQVSIVKRETLVNKIDQAKHQTAHYPRNFDY